VKKPVENICGYELSNPDRELFDSGVMEVVGPCKHCDFAGECLTPCESVRCLIPKSGELFDLGQDQAQNGIKLTYYALIHDAGIQYVELSEPDHYWARARCVEEGQVPNWALSRMRGSQEERL
jgi:hypothetical protein